MKKQRMTLEELRELKPSRTNMIELVCDDGRYRQYYKTISVYSANDTDVFFIDNVDDGGSFEADLLRHYPSFREDPKMVTVYSCRFLGINGRGVYTLERISRAEIVHELSLNDRHQLGPITETEYEVIND